MTLFYKTLLPKPHCYSPSIFSITSRLLNASADTLNSFPDEPTSSYYDELVNSAGQSGDFDTLHHLLNKRFTDGCFNTNNTFTFVTNSETSISALGNLTHTLSRLDKGYARKSAFDSLIARLCKLDLIEESLRVVDSMARGGYGLNSCSFYPIFNALTRKRKLEDCWRVVDLMRKVRVSPDPTVYNYFLTAHCFAGDIPGTAGVLTKMVEEGMSADTRTYDALVLGACKAGKVASALVLLRRMEDDGLPALFSTHVYVLDALLGMGYFEGAIEYVMCYAGRDRWLDTESFGWLANRFIKLKKVDEAKFMVEEMEKRGLKMGDKLKKFYEINVGNN